MSIVNSRHTPYFDPENALTIEQLAFIVALATEANNNTAAIAILSVGTAAPTTTPLVVGDIYVDSTNNRVYVATGTASSADWTEVTGSGAGGVTDGDKGDITVSASGATWTIDNNAVTTAKVADDAVTFDKIENISQNHFLGRHSAGSGSVQTLSVTQAKSILGVGNANGIAELDASGLVPASQLPSYVDDIIEVANFAALPGTGETGKIYVTLDTNLTYRWSGSAYVEISASLALGETSSTAYRGDRGKTAYDYSQIGHVPLAGGVMTGDLQVPADAYGVSWNGNNEVPTKNDLYDKIETITGGGITEAQAKAISRRYALALG